MFWDATFSRVLPGYLRDDRFDLREVHGVPTSGGVIFCNMYPSLPIHHPLRSSTRTIGRMTGRDKSNNVLFKDSTKQNAVRDGHV